MFARGKDLRGRKIRKGKEKWGKRERENDKSVDLLQKPLVISIY